MGGLAQRAKRLTAAYVRMAQGKPTTHGGTAGRWHRFLYTLLSTAYVFLTMTLLRSYGFALGLALCSVVGLFIYIPAQAVLQSAIDRITRSRTDRVTDSAGRPGAS